VALARAEESIPTPSSFPGGAIYEPKWDGYRIAVVRDDHGARLWSRQGKDLTDRFPDLRVAALEQLAPRTVIDAEAVIWNGDRLDFDLLQQRLVNTARTARGLAAKNPASLMVFDLLAREGQDMRRQPLHARREVLEELARTWTPPLQLSPSTTDEEQARAWMRDYRPAGVEGLVVKGADSLYTPGRRSWIKVKSRETVEVIIGAVTGSLERPDTIVAGLYQSGVLRIVGKSTPLTRAQAQELGEVLTPAGQDHPWPDEVSSSRFGSGRDKIRLVKVEPLVVAEVSADAAIQAGTYRHPLRLVRPRFDLAPEDLDTKSMPRQ
jgi:ATP-dependent DNA ligase